jgi:hypothetical protein
VGDAASQREHIGEGQMWVKGGSGRAVLGPSQVPLITAEIVSPVAWFVTLRAPCLPLRKLRQTGGIQMLATVASSSFDTTKRRPSASNRTPPSFSISSSIVFLVTEGTRNPSLAAKRQINTASRSPAADLRLRSLRPCQIADAQSLCFERGNGQDATPPMMNSRRLM